MISSGRDKQIVEIYCLLLNERQKRESLLCLVLSLIDLDDEMKQIESATMDKREPMFASVSMLTIRSAHEWGGRIKRANFIQTGLN